MDVDLYDGLTRAVPSLPACCVKTLNSALDVVNPDARKPLTVQPMNGALLLTLACPVCKKTRRIHIARGVARVDPPQ